MLNPIRPRRLFPWLCVLLSTLGGCSCHNFAVCEPPAPERLARLPPRLSETGLFADVDADTLADGVRPFRPQFELWSDGATKRRWLALPPGERIDTADQDSWRFPEGTRVWKEFSRDGVRVETRLLLKVGPGDAEWASAAYAWSADQSDATLVPDGVQDALGTPHDVPSASDCQACHGGRRSHVLGFSAVQLAYDAPPGLLDLEGLAAEGLLTDALPSGLRVPGDDTERAALGYLHANCAHCHNQQRPPSQGSRCFDPENEVDFWLSVGALGTPSDTPTYRTSFERCVEPGDPDESRLLHLISRREGALWMPPLATEQVDHQAVELLRRWMERLPD